MAQYTPEQLGFLDEYSKDEELLVDVEDNLEKGLVP